MTVCNCVQSFLILRHASQYKSGTNSVGLFDPQSHVPASRIYIPSNEALVHDLDFALDVADVILPELFAYFKEFTVIF